MAQSDLLNRGPAGGFRDEGVSMLLQFGSGELSAGTMTAGLGLSLRRQELAEPLYRHECVLPRERRERNLAAVDSLLAQLAKIAEAAPIEHARQAEREDPAIVLPDEEFA